MTEFPSAKLNAFNTSGTSLGESAPVRGLTWVNLWAAWCEPCKKEIPLMAEFQSKLRSAGVPVALAFVSMDDDQRQLELFLRSGAGKGMSETFWLSEGTARDQWLKDIGLSADPRLPVHFLVNASKKVFCRIEGSVQADDFPLVLAELQKPE
jgi:thiol-disulfide isomerase/thioredoxin